MALKNIWQNKVDDIDYIVAEDINNIANSVIDLEDEIGSFANGDNEKAFAVPSSGLEIENGTVIGIGTCTDEHIVIPEFDNSGNPVTSVASDVFGSLLGDNGGFIKSIVFPPSISWFGEPLMLPISVINTTYCPNLESIYLMNPKIGWEEGVSPFKLESNVKDIYFGGSRKQWIELNTERESPATQLRPDNISAGIVPTIHYSFFAPTSEIERLDSKIGDIDTALDELHNYAEALKSGGEA